MGNGPKGSVFGIKTGDSVVDIMAVNGMSK